MLVLPRLYQGFADSRAVHPIKSRVAMITKPRTSKHALSKPPRRATKINPLQLPELSRLPWLIHGFSTRTGGTTTCYGGRSLNLGFTQHDKRTNVEQNRRTLLINLEATSGKRQATKTWP